MFSPRMTSGVLTSCKKDTIDFMKKVQDVLLAFQSLPSKSSQ